MKQILQNLKTGKIEIVEVPKPKIDFRKVLIKTNHSLISVGTERKLIDFGRASYLGKARLQPEKVKQVRDRIVVDGLFSTFEAVQSKLNQPIPLGYCNAGTVIEIGDGITKFKIGDRVVSNGPHAEIVSIPENLCAKIPDCIDSESAVFAIVGAIGLQGIRLAQPELGEYFVVTGLGLIGLLVVQILTAHGCKVLGIDLDERKLVIAHQFGADIVNLSKGEDPVNYAHIFSKARGVDGVIITASTKSSDPVHQAAQMCRKRGRIILVGVTGLELRRDDFYEKELTFQVSCSYGPGRYDPEYEEKGQDYPFGFVRWTVQRNFEAVLNMMADNRINVEPLVTHRFAFEDAPKAYDIISGVIKSDKPVLGILFDYLGAKIKQEELYRKTVKLKETEPIRSSTITLPTIGVIGAGNFTSRVLLPAVKKTNVRLKTIASMGGLSSVETGRKFGFEQATTDIETILSDSEIDTVFITTRHNTHAELVIKAIDAGKHVFVEKPLALTLNTLEKIESAMSDHKSSILMVGFNRRFAPQIIKIKELLSVVKASKSLIILINAGYIPYDHWVQDIDIGGGRIIGEACHFVDLLRFLVGNKIIKFNASKMTEAYETGSPDKVSFTLSFEDGSIGTVHYLANGHRSFPKERLEVFCAGRILQLNNFRNLRGYGWPQFSKMNLWLQDKGHFACIEAFIKAVSENYPSPIPIDEILEVTRASFDIVKIAR